MREEGFLSLSMPKPRRRRREMLVAFKLAGIVYHASAREAAWRGPIEISVCAEGGKPSIFMR